LLNQFHDLFLKLIKLQKTSFEEVSNNFMIDFLAFFNMASMRVKHTQLEKTSSWSIEQYLVVSLSG